MARIAQRVAQPIALAEMRRSRVKMRCPHRAVVGAALLQSYVAEYVLIDAQHQITVSAGLRDRFTLTASAYTLRGSM